MYVFVCVFVFVFVCVYVCVNQCVSVPVLGEGLASCRPSLTVAMLVGLLVLPVWGAPAWADSSGLSSMFPIRALRMMSSRPRLLAGSLKEWFLGFTVPEETTNEHTHTVRQTDRQIRRPAAGGKKDALS